MPRILPATDNAINEAAAMLRAGGVVAFPTETVYGLGADAFNAGAVSSVYQLKRRPADNPLIVHVIDAEQARRCVAATWDGRCDRLAACCWPGPLTFVLPRRPELPREVAAGRESVAIRSPRHPNAQRLLQAFGGPIAAPSANRSGQISPTTAAHVAHDFADVGDLLILDGGPCDVGIESTVLDMTAEPPRLLRPGSITADTIREVIGRIEHGPVASQGASPGTSTRHYAPRTPTMMLERAALIDRLVGSRASAVAIMLDSPPARAAAGRGARVILMPRDAESYAARLYDALREVDAAGAQSILIEALPDRGGLWASILDRLERACASPPPDRTEMPS